MRKVRNLSVLLLLLLTACATNPSDRYAQAAITMTGINNSVADLYDAGVIDDDEILDLKPALDTANKTLAKAKDRLPEGGQSFDLLLDTLNSATEALWAKVHKAREGE